MSVNLYSGLDSQGKKSAIILPEAAIFDTSGTKLNTKLTGILADLDNLEEGIGMSWGIELKETESSDWGPLLGNQNAWKEYEANIGQYFLETSTGIAYKLKSDDATKLASTGETVNQTAGNIVTIAPALYYRIEDGILWMSMFPNGGKVIETDKINHLCIYGTYLAYETGGKLKSWSGVKPAASRTITSFWNQAQAEGSNYGLIDYDFWKWMYMIVLSKYQTPDLRRRKDLLYGMGGSTTNRGWDYFVSTSTKLTGETNNLNGIWGKVSAPDDITVLEPQACHVLVGGIEDPYNWYWQMTQGVYFGNSGNENQTGTEMYVYSGNRMPSSSELTTHPEGDYKLLTRPTSGGYVKSMILGDDFNVYPKTLGAGASTFWSCYHYANSTGQLLLGGGFSSSGTYSGLGYSTSSNAFSASTSICGSRLAFYGTVAKIQ